MSTPVISRPSVDSIESFFLSDEPEREIVIYERHERPRILLQNGTYTYELMSPI